jgi:hypothetical protein
MKPIIAGSLTVIFLTVMVCLGLRGPVREPDSQASVEETGPHPAEETIRNLVRFGDEGNVENYLDSFVGRMRADLEHEVTEKGREAFAEELIKAASARKGHVVYAPRPENRNSLLVDFEAVYPDRNERQTYRVTRSEETWKISGVSELKGGQPASKFGSEVAPVDPDDKTPEAPATPKVGLSVETGEAPESP